MEVWNGHIIRRWGCFIVIFDFPGGRRISSQPKSILHAATPIAMAVGTQEPRLFWRGGMRSFNRCSCDPRHLMGSRASRPIHGEFHHQILGFSGWSWFLWCYMVFASENSENGLHTSVCGHFDMENYGKLLVVPMINHEIQGAPILRNTKISEGESTRRNMSGWWIRFRLICPDYPLRQLRIPCVFC